MRQLKALRCEIEMADFSSERIFTFSVGNGSYKGVAPWLHFWNEDKRRLARHEPTVKAKGFVAVRVLKRANGQALIELPDSERVLIPKGLLVPSPEAIDTNVLVES